MNTEDSSANAEGAPAAADDTPASSKKKRAPAQADSAPAATENIVKPSKRRAAKPAAGEAQNELNAADGADDAPAGEPQLLTEVAESDEPSAPVAADAEMADDEAQAPVGFDDLVSGRFDDEADSESQLPTKRVLQPQPEQPKLHKVLAQSGFGSRLEMEQMILQGRISVNNQPAHVGQRIQFGDKVKVDGRLIALRIAQPPARVLAYHKPVGEVVTHDDPQNRPTVFRKLPRLQHGKWQSVGRLDLNTEGLLLFTNSGELANRLMHPRFGLEREYAVRVLGALTDEEKQRLLDGVQLEDGIAQFGSIKEEGLGEGANQWYRVTISEGRNREVRRMIESVGHAVSRLIRIRYGAMMLPRGLKRGAWMELWDRDIEALGAASGTPSHVIKGGRDPEQPTLAPKRPGRGDRGRSSGPRPNMANPGGNRSADNAPRAAYGANPMAGRRRTGAGPSGAEGRGQQPDPLRTSQGYIGADSLSRQRRKSGPGAGGNRSGGAPAGRGAAGGNSGGGAGGNRGGAGRGAPRGGRRG